MWTYNYSIPSDELYHHGVIGQKWGRRRYQNEDGSLTNAGQKRYHSDNTKQLEKEYGKLEDQLTYGKNTNLDVTKKGEKAVEKIMRKIEVVRNQKLQKRAIELASKYGDKATVEVKDNKILVTASDGDKWRVY